MKNLQYTWKIIDSNSWLIKEGNKGLLIDAIDSQDLYNDISTIHDLTIILTHAHFDHIIGLNKIRMLKPHAVVIATEKCSEHIGNIYRNMSAIGTAFMRFYDGGGKNNIEINPFVCSQADVTFSERRLLAWCDHKLELIAMHGHTDDGLIVIIDDKDLYSGDTLLPIPTVTRFPTGSSKRFKMEDIPLMQSLKGIGTVFPGHGFPGSIDEMISNNMKTN